MLRWWNWGSRRSRRQKSVRTRILRIDKLENRRLLYSPLLGGSVERSHQHDESESEDRFEIDDDERATILGTAAVVESHDAEGEGDGWESQADGWEGEADSRIYVILAAPVGSKQVPAGSPESPTAQKQVSPDTSLPTTATVPTASEIGKSAGSGKDLAEAESSASEADIQTDRDALQSSDGNQPAARPSTGQTEIAILDAATAIPIEEKADANPDPKVAGSPTGLSAPMTAGDGRIALGGEERQSQAANRAKASGSRAALEMPSPPLDGPQRHALTATERLSHHPLRPMKIPPNASPEGHAQIFAAMAAESSGTGNWRLREALSQDLAALETALHDLLADSGEMGRDMAGWLLRADVIHWTLAATIALLAAETVRRKTQRPRSIEHQPPHGGVDISLHLFPELLGFSLAAKP
jgi:hypothetical protein